MNKQTAFQQAKANLNWDATNTQRGARMDEATRLVANFVGAEINDKQIPAIFFSERAKDVQVIWSENQTARIRMPLRQVFDYYCGYSFAYTLAAILFVVRDVNGKVDLKQTNNQIRLMFAEKGIVQKEKKGNDTLSTGKITSTEQRAAWKDLTQTLRNLLNITATKEVSSTAYLKARADVVVAQTGGAEKSTDPKPATSPKFRITEEQLSKKDNNKAEELCKFLGDSCVPFVIDMFSHMRPDQVNEILALATASGLGLPVLEELETA